MDPGRRTRSGPSLVALIVSAMFAVAAMIPADGVVEIADVAAEALSEIDVPVDHALVAVARPDAVRAARIGRSHDDLDRSVAPGPPPLPPPER